MSLRLRVFSSCWLVVLITILGVYAYISRPEYFANEIIETPELFRDRTLYFANYKIVSVDESQNSALVQQGEVQLRLFSFPQGIWIKKGGGVSFSGKFIPPNRVEVEKIQTYPHSELKLMLSALVTGGLVIRIWFFWRTSCRMH